MADMDLVEKVARATLLATGGHPYAGKSLIAEASWHPGMLVHVKVAEAAIAAIRKHDEEAGRGGI